MTFSTHFRALRMAAALGLTTCISTTAAMGDTIIVGFDDGIIRDNLCLGNECPNDNPPYVDGFASSLLIMDVRTRIDFEDTSVEDDTFPRNDWSILINENLNNGSSYFAVQDRSAGRIPFRVEAGAPTNALFVAPNGNVGFGTALPLEPLHITNQSQPTIRLERTQMDSPYSWHIASDSTGFAIQDRGVFTNPFIIEDGSPTHAFYLAGNGALGLGTSAPQGQLELSAEDSFNFFRITATGAAVNESVDITFTGGPLGTGQLRYNIVDGDNQEMSLDADGNMVLDGTLTTAGPTCAGGCDRVFDAGYALPGIQDHANDMFGRGYLPSVGPTHPGQPINVSEKMGNMLNALELAHIFIAQQQELMTALQQDHDQLRAEHAALARTLEALQDRQTD